MLFSSALFLLFLDLGLARPAESSLTEPLADELSLKLSIVTDSRAPLFYFVDSEILSNAKPTDLPSGLARATVSFEDCRFFGT